MADNILDVFNQDAFGVVSLTDAINKIPFTPSRAGEVINWETEGINTLVVAIEEMAGELKLLNPSARGGPGETADKEKRKMRHLELPHYKVNDGIYADEVLGVRQFGRANVLETLQNKVTQRMFKHINWTLNPTLEYQALGAVKGTILNANGSTLLDLFDAFEVTQIAEVDFDLDNATPAKGALRNKCDDVDRLVAAEMGGVSYSRLYAFCGTNFWKDLIAHGEIEKVLLAQPAQAARLLDPMAYKSITVGPITFEEYRGSVGATAFVNTDKCHIFPLGTPGLWRRIFGPANYVETAGDIGLPRYVKQWRMPNDTGITLELQSNPLHYCTRPRTLIQGKRT